MKIIVLWVEAFVQGFEPPLASIFLCPKNLQLLSMAFEGDTENYGIDIFRH